MPVEYDSHEEALASGDVSETRLEPDMGLFPTSADRAFRFLSSYAIEQAVETTGDSEGSSITPVHIVTIGAGFPWTAAMQVNEHRKRSDSGARPIKVGVNNSITLGISFQEAGFGESEKSSVREALLAKSVGEYIRTAAADLLFDPPQAVLAETKGSKRHKALIGHFEDYLLNADELSRRKNEPESEVYRSRGGWEVIYKEPAMALRRELAQRLGSDESAVKSITLLARLIAQQCPGKLRPFMLSILDTKSRDELAAQAEVIYEGHPEVTDTVLYREALGLLDVYHQQEKDYELAPIEDGSATVVAVCHWPLRHRRTGEADDAGWSYLLLGLEHKLQTHGIAVFFPWDLPQSSDPNHLDITLGGVQSMMIKDFPFEVSIVSEPVETILAAIGSIGSEPAILAPQLRHGGQIGRLIIRKRLTLSKALRLDTDH